MSAKSFEAASYDATRTPAAPCYAKEEQLLQGVEAPPRLLYQAVPRNAELHADPVEVCVLRVQEEGVELHDPAVVGQHE